MDGTGIMEAKTGYDPSAKLAEPQDPWQNRSKGMRCESCMFFLAKQSNPPRIPLRIGRCRRNSPTIKGFPVVFTDDWCGEHRLDENKL